MGPLKGFQVNDNAKYEPSESAASETQPNGVAGEKGGAAETAKKKEKVNGKAAPASPESASRAGDSSPGKLPRIQILNRQLRNVTADSLAALRQSNSPPSLFVHANRLAYVRCDESGHHYLCEAHDYVLRNHLTRAADFYAITSEGAKNIAPPMDVVKDLQATPPQQWQLPLLRGVVEAPVLRADGTILLTPGYDKASGLFYAPAAELRIPDIPDHPTAGQVDAARAQVLDIIADFPFVDEASKSNAVGTMLTPIARPAILGPTPIALFDATTAGSVKTMLADLVSILVSGREGSLFSAPKEDSDWRKQLTAILREHASVVVIDNVRHVLDSAELCRALTATIYADRILGKSQTVQLPVRCTWIATGNNMQLGGDMPRRAYWIRMEPQCSQAYRRTEFRHPHLKEYVHEHRGELLAALLTLARAWFAAGRPQPNLKPLGSFERWSTIVGGILQYARVGQFLDNSEQLYAQVDIESAQWEALFETLDAVFHSKSFTIAQIWEEMHRGGNTITKTLSEGGAALRECILDYLAEFIDREGQFKRRLGWAFRVRLGQRYGDAQMRIVRDGEDTHLKTAQWKIERG